MKFYAFLEREPKVPDLVVIEGTEPVLAQRAVEMLLERLVPEEMRQLNVDVIDGPQTQDIGRLVADATSAMPFLAERRVVVVRGCHELRAQPRRDVWAAAETMPAGNVLILEDLFPPNKKTRPEPFGQLAGRRALRIDTTVDVDTRERFVQEVLQQLGARAKPRVIAMLAESDADLGAIRSDLEKLALGGGTIEVADLEREALSVEDPKAWHYASALVAGRADEALAIAHELFAGDPRGAAVPLVSALATEFGLLWELARPGGGALPARHRWRERTLAPIARRIGERRARFGYEAAVRGFEAVVTGRTDDPRGMIDVLTAELAVRLGASRA